MNIQPGKQDFWIRNTHMHYINQLLIAKNFYPNINANYFVKPRPDYIDLYRIR